MKKFFSLFMGLAMAMGAMATTKETISIEANTLAFSIEAIYGLQYGAVGGYSDEWAVQGILTPKEGNNYYTTYSTANEDIMLSVYHASNLKKEIELTVSSAELKSTDKGDQFIAVGTDTIGNTYNINLTLFAPDQPKDTVDIAFGEVTYMKRFGQDYYFTARNGKYYAKLDIYTDELEGSYTKNDFYMDYTGLLVIENGDTSSVGRIYNVEAQIILTGDVYQISAQLFATDSIYYRMTMTYQKPAYADTVKIAFTEPVSIDYYGAEWYFAALNDQYIFQMDYFSETVTGEFYDKNSDFNAQYTGLFAINGTDTSYVRYNDLTAVITEDESKYYVEAKYYGMNNTLYLISVFGNKPAAEDTVQVTVTDAEMTDYSAYGMFQVRATSTDPAVTLVITLNSYSLEGSFTYDDIALNYSGIISGGKQYQIVDGAVTSTLTADALTLQGWLLGKNNVLYQFTISVPQSQEGIENIELSEKVQKVVIDGALYIIRNNKLFNVQGVQVR